MLTDKDLFEALTLLERSPVGDFRPDDIESWFSGFDISDDRVGQYLDSEDVDLRSLGARLTSVVPVHAEAPWMNRLRLMLDSGSEISYPGAEIKYGPEVYSGGLFPQFFAPFINFALHSLDPLLSSSFDNKESLRADLYASLFAELLKDALPSLVEFYHGSGLTRIEFEESFCVLGKHEAFLREFPVLARILVNDVDCFVANIIEMLSDLLKDEESLINHGFIHLPVSDLVSIAHGLGDPHQGHKVVCALTFGDKVLYYRPRGGDEYSLYNRIVDVLGLGEVLPKIKHLSNGSRCWVAECKVCTVEEISAPQHCYKMGILAAIFYALGAKDMHMENVIATSSGPAPIDLETILAPSLAHPSLEAFDLAKQILNDGPIGTGIFPVGSALAGLPSMEVSALMGGLKPATGEYVGLEDPFGESIRFVDIDGEVGSSQNLPIGATDDYILDNLDWCIDGFREGIGRVTRHLGDILSVVTGFSSLRCRVLVRPTATYDIALRTLRHPNYMRSMLARERFFLRFWAKSDISNQLPGEMIAAEKSHMLFGDIPYFTMRISNRVVDDCNSSELVKQSPVDRTARLLKTLLDPVEVAESQLYVEEVLSCASDRPRVQLQPLGDSLVQAEIDEDAISSLADEYFQRFLHFAVLGDRDAAWIGFTSAQDNQSVRLTPVGTSLYDGSAGIALALASFYRASGDEAAKALALRALEPVLSQSRLFVGFSGFPIGGFSGMSAALYATAKCRQLLDEPILDNELDPGYWVPLLRTNIQEDNYLDLMTGSAGALSVVCSLVSADIWKIEDAELAIRELQSHLVERAVRPEIGVGQAWKSGDEGILLGGLSHGSAGIAVALARSTTLVPSNEVTETVQEAVNFESNYFSKSKQLWRDMRKESISDELYPNHWCHGSAGIVLAQTLIRKFMGGKVTVPPVSKQTWKMVTASEGAENHSLCHGSFGNALSMEPVDHVAYRGMLVQALKDLQGSSFVPGLDLNVSLVPGIMLGHAGALYTLSKYLCPEIPNVLWLE